MKMDTDEAIGTIVLGLVFVVVVSLLFIAVVDEVRNGGSDVLCKSRGYDYGTNLFWKNVTVCTTVVQKEKLELTCIPEPCR
jgi:hypothetical protein